MAGGPNAPKAAPQTESWLLSAPAIDAWLADAAIGDMLIYARVTALPRGSAGAARVRALAEAGRVQINQVPAANAAPGLRDYVMRKRAPARSAPPRPVRIARPEIDGDMARLLRVLRCYAQEGQPCPENQTLARLAKLKSKARASYVLCQLVAARRIVVEHLPLGRRRITLLPSGARTADPFAHTAFTIPPAEGAR